MESRSYCEMLQKRNNRENETPAQFKKRAAETAQQCKVCIARENEQRRKRRAMQKEITREVADERSGNQETIIHPQQETIIQPQQETIIHLQQETIIHP
ncbi:hypothetical protein C2G38_2189031 [Gigaspora rosea]|uniref:Uncharacterized protein n=1 Tax=Gigaspora rosea TaxID=44941 RepID=A0A397V438_9GLOM|nr:hypothetical protein C2G38_2189031 [Gigaspora rosea]